MLSLHSPWTEHWKAVALGVGSLVSFLWIRREVSKPWAPLWAEWVLAQILWHDGIRRIFLPSAEDGTLTLSFWDRFRRVAELRAILALERFHQIDAARRTANGENGWGKTTGTHHMQHLPGLVFRGEDQDVVREALHRSARIFQDSTVGFRLHQDWERTPILKDLVLVGGGHSHVNVLRMLGMEPLPGVRVTLVTRDVETPYSGMLPAHVAGLYTRRECHLDLNVLARFARVRLVHATAVSIDLQKKHVNLEGDRPPIAYDVLSINIGSAPRVQVDASTEGITPVKPIDGFGARWDDLLARVPSWTGSRRLLVVGGGAGGFELAATMRARLTSELKRLNSTARITVGLVTRSGLLPQHTAGARCLAEKALKQRGIEVYTGYDVTRAEAGVLHCSDGKTLKYDDCIWCTQGSPQSWVASCGLCTDKDGFLLVDQQMRCRPKDATLDIGHVFAGGDIASAEGHPRPKAGVFAVMAGMVLWINIRASLTCEKLVTYWPQHSFLGLLNLGDGTCIASRGTLATEGAWLWGLKDWIDRRWMWNYFEGLPEMPASLDALSPGLAVAKAAGGATADLLKHSIMRCGGCGAKVGATTLERAMSRVDFPKQPGDGKAWSCEAEVVIGTGDDAAVVDLITDGGGKVSSVQTIDFFRSFIGDPYQFGRIAAVHALSDCEAMGAIPQTALALVQVPFASEDKQEEDLVQLMAGAASALKRVNCALVGGHTCESRELGLGFAISGRLPGGSTTAMTKVAMRGGDVLILTKPLGTGTLFAADMRAKARGPWIATALKSMETSNREAATCLRAHGALACTDITGFGLIGHLVEMCRQSGVQASLELSKVPVYDGALDCLKMGIESSLQPANVRLRRAVANHEEVRGRLEYLMLFDPQTSGGLLAAVPQAQAEACVSELRASGAAPSAAIIGSASSSELAAGVCRG
ncbi:selD [Symbiodinium sp. KB8]|nr:selD [Symbiodinium sp. KB8]